VFKAPANETIRGVLALERTLTEDEQGLLNENEINVLRAFPGRGPVVWGARTLSKSTQWKFINVRRLLLFIEESIQEGTRFAVFEPNNLALWQTVKRQVTEFLTRVWRDGGLFGATPDQAFRVRVDEELNPPSTRALGQLVIEVIVVPTTPAEFIVFRVIQDSTGASLQE
jgi:phage tail sheath protein FI